MRPRGGRGTNQYAIKGVSIRARSTTTGSPDLVQPPPPEPTPAEIARRIDTSTQTLEMLERSSPSEETLYAILDHPACPESILIKYASSPDISIRYRIAAHESTPPIVLHHLYETDTEPLVRMYLARNPNTPSADLAGLPINSVVDNPACPVDKLRQWGSSKDSHTRLRVAQHPNTPLDTLCILAVDTDPLVRHSAWNHPRMTDEARAIIILAR